MWQMILLHSQINHRALSIFQITFSTLEECSSSSLVKTANWVEAIRSIQYMQGLLELISDGLAIYDKLHWNASTTLDRHWLAFHTFNCHAFEENISRECIPDWANVWSCPRIKDPIGFGDFKVNCWQHGSYESNIVEVGSTWLFHNFSCLVSMILSLPSPWFLSLTTSSLFLIFCLHMPCLVAIETF